MAMRGKDWTVVAVLFAFLFLPPAGIAAGKGHEGMHGTKQEGSKEGHGGTMKMGDKIFGGKVGPWNAEARLIDMKAHMEKAKASGMKMEGMKSHHIALHLSDPGTKKPFAVSEGKGTVTVTGPDRKTEKYDFMAMEGHFGADVSLPKPGKYTFKTEIESGGKKGSATFSHTVK
jgi:hypothetical protein